MCSNSRCCGELIVKALSLKTGGEIPIVEGVIAVPGEERVNFCSTDVVLQVTINTRAVTNKAILKANRLLGFIGTFTEWQLAHILSYLVNIRNKLH
jgi:hypothetical protein